MARKPRHLSADEERLWSNVAATATPLNPKPKPPVRQIAAKPAPKKPHYGKPDPVPEFVPEFMIGERSAGPGGVSARLVPDVAARVAAHPVRMDKNAFRKLSRGRMTPEARIDLHGMTLAQAHPTLVGFILRCHGQGKRLVLVITGKGRGGRDGDGPIPERRGALREQVPGWLSAQPCGAVVLQIAQAHASHGGGGAYYVYLRRGGA